MAKTDANPPMPEWSSEYDLEAVDTDYISRAVKPKSLFTLISQSVLRARAASKIGALMEIDADINITDMQQMCNGWNVAAYPVVE